MSDTDFESMSASDVAQLAAMSSQLVARKELASQAGEMYNGDRDLYEALGYDRNLTYADYRNRYERGGIAKGIIDKPPETTWSERPEIVDDADVGEDSQTDFERNVEELFDAGDETSLNRGLRHYFERADKLSRIGHYGVLFMGLADVDAAKELKQPVQAGRLSSLDDLLYLTPLGEGDVEIHEWVTDATDPRHGLPKTYKLNLAGGDRTETEIVHHSRVIHIAEGVLDDEINGEPALRAVMNRLFDIEKIVGAAAEAFWRVSNPGLAMNVDPEYQNVDTDVMDEQAEEWEHNMRRVLKLYGTDVEQLDAQDVDPEPALDAALKLVSGTIEIPQRKLVGSERGELASSQDEASYLEMISARQTSFAEPVILRALLDRLTDWGIVAQPRAGSYDVEWPDLFQLNELEQAQVKKAEGQALKAGAPMGDPSALHSPEALREWSPVDEPEDATPPDEQPDPDEEIDEEDPEVVDQFEEMMQGRHASEADD